MKPLNETLTKENFWNEIMDQYPKACKLFCDWIDEYKEAVSWNSIIAGNNKYHDLPYAMQQGIWIEFATQILNDFFEQPEYEYNFDLMEDIKMVFSEIEELIEVEDSLKAIEAKGKGAK